MGTKIQNNVKKVGQHIAVKANEILGTEEAKATILEVTEYGYIVHIHGDPKDEFGPVDFDGEVLSF